MKIAELLKKKETLYAIGGVAVIGVVYYAYKNRGASSGTATATPSDTQTPTSNTGTASSGSASNQNMQAAIALAQIQSAEKIAANRDAAQLEAARIAAQTAKDVSSNRTTQAALGAASTPGAQIGINELVKAFLKWVQGTTPTEEIPRYDGPTGMDIGKTGMTDQVFANYPMPNNLSQVFDFEQTPIGAIGNNFTVEPMYWDANTSDGPGGTMYTFAGENSGNSGPSSGNVENDPNYGYGWD